MIDDPLRLLGETLEPGEADRLSAALAMDRAWPDVLKELREPRRTDLRPLLEASRDVLGNPPSSFAAVLRGISAAGRRERGSIDLVWSGPMPAGASGRSTHALAADLIDDADHHVIAATYSVSTSSPYVKALQRAVARDVEVVMLVDPEHQEGGVGALMGTVPGARFLRLPPSAPGIWTAMHAKFVVVDDEVALVTSANFSEAAADRNVELGVVIEHTGVARALSEHVEALLRQGKLIACS